MAYIGTTKKKPQTLTPDIGYSDSIVNREGNNYLNFEE